MTIFYISTNGSDTTGYNLIVDNIIVIKFVRS